PHNASHGKTAAHSASQTISQSGGLLTCSAQSLDFSVRRIGSSAPATAIWRRGPVLGYRWVPFAALTAWRSTLGGSASVVFCSFRSGSGSRQLLRCPRCNTG